MALSLSLWISSQQVWEQRSTEPAG
uniref:Uncharacterized protein n=1 Tax=Anguilla anguilla TaxID=7936 RepID=A0A0E9S5W0_ANGAN